MEFDADIKLKCSLGYFDVVYIVYRSHIPHILCLED